VLVTGGTGFVGRNLVHLLHEQGYEVTVLHRPSSRLDGFPKGVRFRAGDVTRPETLQGCCDGMDWVFHVAGVVKWGKISFKQLVDSHVNGTVHIAEEALKSGVKRFVHTSSAAAVGLPAREVADETFPFNGDELNVGYAIAKRRAEEKVLALVQRGLPVVVVNPTVVIGPRAPGPTFVRSVMRGKLRVAPPGGINAVDAEDVARGHLLAARHGKIGERYILGGINLPLRQLLQQVADVAGTGITIREIPRGMAFMAALSGEGISLLTRREPPFAWDLAKLAGRDIYYSSHKAERELGYTVTPLVETIRKTVEWEKRRMTERKPGE
jgi:dihydroflavonol-4-reductase